ncbi:MAG: hypothetical protein K0R09_1062 [Clostridiales bacterium]|jgi:hypothetical protein|nr:hypothetical protein [Clostridiales bacterium]
MNKLKCFFIDIVKCIKYALFISFLIAAITTIVFLLSHNGITIWLLSDVKKYLYYSGCFTLFISIGFFLQKRTLRPLVYEKDWKKNFSKLSLSFVIMFTGFFVCGIGMILQFIFESLLK